MSEDCSDPPEGNGSIATRFKKGHPKLGGRKKGAKNTSTLLRIHVHDKVQVKQNGKTRKISKLELGAIRVTDKIAQGDLKAFEYYEQMTAETGLPSVGALMDPLDELTLQHVIEHLSLRFEDSNTSPLSSTQDDSGCSTTEEE